MCLSLPDFPPLGKGDTGEIPLSPPWGNRGRRRGRGNRLNLPPEDLFVQVQAKARGEGFPLPDPEGSLLILQAFRPEKEDILHSLLVNAMGKFVEMGDKEDADSPFRQSHDDLSRDLRAFPLVGGPEGLIQQE